MDSQLIPFDYEVAGCINGAHAAFGFEGTVAANRVQFEMRATSPESPLMWDELVLAVAIVDPLIFLSLDLVTARRSEAPSTFRVESGLQDDGKKAIGRFVLQGVWEWVGGRLAIRGQLVDAWLSFEPMERVTHVSASSSMSVLSTDVGGAVATRVVDVETSRGNSYLVTSVSRCGPLPLDGDGEGLLLRTRWTKELADAGSPHNIVVEVETSP